MQIRGLTHRSSSNSAQAVFYGSDAAMPGRAGVRARAHARSWTRWHDASSWRRGSGKRRAGVVHDEVVGVGWCQFAGVAIAQKLIERRLDLAPSRNPGRGRSSRCAGIECTISMPSALACCGVGSTPGSVWKFGSCERNERIFSLSLSTNGNPKIIQRNNFGHQVRMLLGKIHRRVAAVGMSDQRQVGVVGVRLTLLELLDHKQDVGFAFFINRWRPT